MTATPLPTEAELHILAVLWREGPCTVRQVHEALGEEGRGYTTTLKLMQLMTSKGLVRRETSQRSHVYRAAHQATRTRRRLVADLADKAFDGSRVRLALRALSGHTPTADEIAELRYYLDGIEEASR